MTRKLWVIEWRERKRWTYYGEAYEHRTEADERAKFWQDRYPQYGFRVVEYVPARAESQAAKEQHNG